MSAGRLTAWGRRSSTPAADPDARPKVLQLPTRSKSNDALEYDEEMNARPPLLKHRHSAYFDALQQLDEQEAEQEGARRYAQPEPPQGGYASRLWSMVRARSSGDSSRPGTPTSPNAKRRATVSGEQRRRAAEAGECAPAVSALVLHRTSSDERVVGALEISTEGGERPKAGPESNRGVRKAQPGDGPKAFAFMDAPEPFMQVNSTAHLSSSLLEAAFLMLLGVLTAARMLRGV